MFNFCQATVTLPAISFGKRLKLLAEVNNKGCNMAKQKSLKQMAKELGVSGGYISR